MERAGLPGIARALAAFTDALHAGPKDDIARDDAALAATLVLLVQIATSWTAHFAQVSSGKNVSQTDEDEFEAKMKPVHEALVRRRRVAHEPVFATVEALDFKLLPRLDAILPADFRREHDLAFAGYARRHAA